MSSAPIGCKGCPHVESVYRNFLRKKAREGLEDAEAECRRARTPCLCCLSSASNRLGWRLRTCQDTRRLFRRDVTRTEIGRPRRRADSGDQPGRRAPGRPGHVASLLQRGLAAMFHRYDYISFFMSCINIPVSFGDLFQRVASIDDRFYLSSLDKLFEEN